MSLHAAWPNIVTARSSARPVSLRRLSALAPLSAADEALVHALKPRTIPSGVVLTDHLSLESDAWILLEGWCARLATPRHAKQFTHLLLPGDPINVLPAAWAGDRLPVMALTPVIAVDASLLRQRLSDSGRDHRALQQAFERAVVNDQACCINTIIRLGQQAAYGRLAHLLLELHTRLAAIGQTHQNRFAMPITQDVLAQTLGLSLVHVSRTLRQMRNDDCIAMSSGTVDLLDRDALVTAAGDCGLAV